MQQLCVFILRYDDKNPENLQKAPGLFQFLCSFYHPAYASEFGLNILHMVPSNSNPVLAFHKKGAQGDNQFQTVMKIIDVDAGSLNTDMDVVSSTPPPASCGPVDCVHGQKTEQPEADLKSLSQNDDHSGQTRAARCCVLIVDFIFFYVNIYSLLPE